jgi:hypothetical protein
MTGDMQALNRTRDEARKRARTLIVFDFTAPAELFTARSNKYRGKISYKRFDTGAEAVRFAIENISRSALLGAYLESDEKRFDGHEIRSLYESEAYPLQRLEAVD